MVMGFESVCQKCCSIDGIVRGVLKCCLNYSNGLVSKTYYLLKDISVISKAVLTEVMS